MKKVFCLLIIISCRFSVHAQLYDVNRIYGDRIYDTTSYFGNGRMVMTTDTVYAVKKQYNLPMAEATVTASDANGNLLFYSNGMRIMDSTGTIIESGDSLNYGVLWEYWYPSMINGTYGYSNPNSLIYIPTPENDSIAFLFHTLSDYLFTDSNNFFCYTKILLKPNIRAVEKNVKLSLTEFVSVSNTAACKHGNGRDWWIIFREANTNCFIKFLLTPDTLFRVGKQCIGDKVNYTEGIGARFSPDGSKFASSGSFSGVNIFDFDRCDGNLSNFKSIPRIFIYDSTNHNYVTWALSHDFSPNSKYLYVTLSRYIFQFDLTASNIASSLDTIAGLVPYTDTLVNGVGIFYYCATQYGLDGKIYISHTTSHRFLCRINYPDSAGQSCGFRLREIELPVLYSYSYPYYPNYRLGRMLGSACDSIYSDVKPIYTETPWLKVYPNPATDLVRFDYNWVEWEAITDCELRIADLQGRVVLSQKIPKYSSKQDVSIKQLAAGVYTISLQNNEQKIAVCKLTKMN